MASLKDIISNHLTIFILLVFAGTVCGAASVDIDGSGVVDFNDLAIMQYYWLDAGPVADIWGADGNSDGVVDGLDFSVLGGSWLDDTSETIGALVAEAQEFSGQQLLATHAGAASYTSYPKMTEPETDPDNHYAVWQLKASSDWTSGFIPGCLWQMYELTGDPNYKDAAELWLVGLEGEKTTNATHNIGFIMMSSYGNGYRLTGDANYKSILLTAAQTYSLRWSPIIDSLHSRGSMGSSTHLVSIDNMMSIEHLFWASKNGGDPNFYDMAVSHAYKTAENHVRADGSTNHRLYYDLTDPCGETFQVGSTFGPGYSADSSWSRGQGWAVYGFTMCYRETGDPNFLDTAKLVSDYFVDNLPADFVPYYDFNDPNIPNVIRDTSAASVAAAGLLELSTFVSDPNLQQKYFQAAKNILTSLSTRDSNGGYLAKDAVGDPLSPSIMMRGYKGVNSSPDKLYERGTSWGDYYFIEALVRYKNMVGG